MPLIGVAPFIRLKFAPVTVAPSMSLLNVAVTTAFCSMPVIPLAGDFPVTSGTVGTAVVKLQILLAAMATAGTDVSVTPVVTVTV